MRVRGLLVVFGTQTFMAVVLPGLLGVKGFRFYVSRRHELICPIGRTM